MQHPPYQNYSSCPLRCTQVLAERGVGMEANESVQSFVNVFRPTPRVEWNQSRAVDYKTYISGPGRIWALGLETCRAGRRNDLSQGFLYKAFDLFQALCYLSMLRPGLRESVEATCPGRTSSKAHSGHVGVPSLESLSVYLRASSSIITAEQYLSRLGTPQRAKAGTLQAHGCKPFV